MTRNHLKRLAAPKTWGIEKKRGTFIVRPNPGSHKLDEGTPLAVVLRDMLGLAGTMREVKVMLQTKQVTINGKRSKDPQAMVGFMDIVGIIETKSQYRLSVSERGKLVAITVKDSAVVSKIRDKTVMKGGRIQLNLTSGANVLVEKDTYKTGDTIILEKKGIKESFSLKKGAPVILSGGKHIGKKGVIDDIKGDKIIFIDENKIKVETAKKYAFVVGKDKPQITVQ